MSVMDQSVLVRFARFYAAVEHSGQQYSGGLPYTHHLAAVVEVCERFAFGPLDEHFVASCWLHDVVEDTGIKLKEVSELFGERVAELVGAVTNEPGPNRKVRAALTYPKTRSVTGAVMLKLCDRIANVEHGGKLVDMYRKEHEDFRRALYTPGEYESLWKHLDALLAPPCGG